MPKGFYQRRPVKERLLEKTVKTSSCCLFNGASLRSGYGCISIDDKTYTTHRVSWNIFNGEIPLGFEVCHKCNIKKCINPSHLYLASRRKNSLDAVRDGLIKVGEEHGSSKLTYKDVLYIRSNYKKGIKGNGSYLLAKKFYVHPTTIHRIATGKTWFHERKNNIYKPSIPDKRKCLHKRYK